MHIYEDIKKRANFDYGIMQNLKAHLHCEQSFIVSFSWSTRRERESKIASILWTQFSVQVNLVFSRQTVFSIASVCLLINSCDHNWTRCIIRDTRLLDLGSKLFPSNIQRMLNENVTRFTQSLLKYSKDWASKRKFLLARLGKPF